MEKEDKVWYEAFLKGDQESFGKLILKYQKRLIYFINQIVKNIDVSEDLAEDVFVYMLIHQKEYDFKFSFQNEKAPVNRVFTVSDAFHSMRKKRLELSQD